MTIRNTPFGNRERAHLEEAQADEREGRAGFDPDERRRAAPTAQRREAERGAGAPAPLLRLHDRVDEHEQAGRHRDRAHDVEVAACRPRPASWARAGTPRTGSPTPIGTLMKKIHSQESVSVRTPPSSRPTALPPEAIAAQIESALVRSAPSREGGGDRPRARRATAARRRGPGPRGRRSASPRTRRIRSRARRPRRGSRRRRRGCAGRTGQPRGRPAAGSRRTAACRR